VSKTVVVHQPDFLPYLGFFHRFLHADTYVALDHVQFVQHSAGAWTHRDKIKTRQGEAWLSLSVKKCTLDTAIKDVTLSDQSSWKASNLNLLRENYGKAPFFAQMFSRLESLYNNRFERMVSFNLALIDMVCDLLNIRIERINSSDLDVAGRKSDMVAAIVGEVGGTRYLSGKGAAAYHDQTPFEGRGIEVIWQRFEHPVYPQQFGNFIPYLSVIDALFNCGPDETSAMLRRA
jgi:hypothetical protein